MIEIIQYIAECYTCIYRWKYNHYSKCLEKAKNKVFLMRADLPREKGSETSWASSDAYLQKVIPLQKT